MSKTDLVVKTNQLNSAVQNLSLPELRIIQLAIVDARETGKGLDTKTPLRIDAMRYAQAFDTTRQNAYILMKQSEETLFNRRFTYFDREKSPLNHGGCKMFAIWMMKGLLKFALLAWWLNVLHA